MFPYVYVSTFDKVKLTSTREVLRYTNTIFLLAFIYLNCRLPFINYIYTIHVYLISVVGMSDVKEHSFRFVVCGDLLRHCRLVSEFIVNVTN